MKLLEAALRAAGPVTLILPVVGVGLWNEVGVPDSAARLLAALLDNSPAPFIVGLLGLLALDARKHIVVPVLRALGARWAKRIAPPSTSRDRPRRPRRGSRRSRTRRLAQQ